MDDFLRDSGEIEASGSGLSNKRRGGFATTLWSVVLDAGTHDCEKAARALHQLCSIYWYPIYAFIRRRGANVHEAEDLTQSFFAHLLEGQKLKTVDQNKGRFRSYLLAALINFLNSEWVRDRTLKRGGRCQIISLD